jgi:hypothetical protein
MPDFNVWMSDKNKIKDFGDDIEGDFRSQHFTQRAIADKPTTITIQRGVTTLSPQTVRVETTRIEPYEQVGAAGRGNRANVLVIGYRGHSTEPDFDVKSGDVFTADSVKVRVRLVYKQNAGITEAWCDIWE